MRCAIASFLAVVFASQAMAADWSSGVSYSYDGSGNIRQIGTDRYVYDVAGRLVQADTNGIRRKYEYDSFGNRKSCSQPGTDCQWGYDISSANNHITALRYTPAGNVETFAGHTYSYDAANMQTRDESASGIREYIYTADDERIAVYTVNTGSWHWTLRDTSGRVLRELTSQDGSSGPGTASWKWIKDYIWRDNLLLATRQIEPGATTPTTYHYHLDHLGSPRQITDDANRIVGTHHYHPFGPEQTQNQQNERSHTLLKYTGHERDLVGAAEGLDTLDYLHARYYSPAMGRFLSVDPAGWDLRRPQSWNRYSYVLNNPVNLTDPTGSCVWDICVGEGTVLAATVLTAATAYAVAPSVTVPGKSNGRVMVDATIDGFQAVGGWLLNGSGGGSDEMAAQTMIQNWQQKEQESATADRDPKRRFSKGDRDAALDQSKDAEGTPRCEYCGTELSPHPGSGDSYEADHRNPHAQGGRSTQDNLAPSCRDCNREKGNRTPEQWKKDKEQQ